MERTSVLAERKVQVLEGCFLLQNPQANLINVSQTATHGMGWNEKS